MQDATQARIAVIGLGNMGSGMAANLIKGGFSVVGCDFSPERRAALEALGAKATDDAASIVDQVDAVLLSLPGPKESEAVLLGEHGLIAKLRPGTAIINASTISKELMLRLAEAAAARGIDFLDAPVTGAADGAAAGTLIFMIGCDETVFDRWRPVFEPMASVVQRMGDVGTGSAAKLLTNLLWFTHVIAICDTMAAGVKAGISAEALQQLIPVSAGGTWVSNHDLPNIHADDDDASFTLALCCKDQRLIRELTSEMDALPLLLETVEGQFKAAMEQYGGQGGELAVSRLTEARVGVSIRAAR